MPYAPWEREGRCVFIDELPGMTTDRLRTLKDDMRLVNSTCNHMIATDQILLAQCPATQPMTAREIRKRISRLLTSKNQAKLIMIEADRLIRDRNREANKPKNKKSPICMNQADHNELTGISRKLQSLKMQALFPALRREIGIERFGKIEAEASAVAVSQFKEWALRQGVRPDWAEHLASAEQLSMEKLAPSFTSPLS